MSEQQQQQDAGSKIVTLGVPKGERLPDAVVIQLRYPIKSDLVPNLTNDGVLREVKLRRPKTRDRIIVNRKLGNPAEKELALVSMLSDIPEEVLHLLDMTDYEQVQEGLGKFSPIPSMPSDGSSE